MLSNKEKSIFAKIVEAFSFNVVSEMGEKTNEPYFAHGYGPSIQLWHELCGCFFLVRSNNAFRLLLERFHWTKIKLNGLSHTSTHTHTPSYGFILHRICNINKHVKYPTNSTYINWYWYNAVCVRFAAKRYEHALIMFEHTITHGVVCLIWHRIQLLCTVIES